MPTPEPKRDEDAVRRYVESLGLVLSQIGMQRMAARVFAALMTTDEGQLTAAELAARLSVSPAAVSGAVRYLEQVGLVTKVREPGERRDHYRLYDDLWYATFLKRDRFLLMWRDAAEEGIDALGADTPAGQRLTEMQDFLSFALKEITSLYDRWHAERQKAK
ncbi:MarR family transcriptional regulator [Amycolatopsis sp. PS_44_ISF1]|uniref:GbsR/MarR family transcriptional regulator n=1 Tax=Amycolatopsis sp. PS_44_ISF1 TaxID=2974917 RepID=UPI0028DE958A|nr:MarR family transcriptional regulator [Amycolatopsis sp. PS_44_ISF1]MDT8910192.1 MarR family transcriptional regulator [Amycolatopsis sp. PS_44_ISF1]MDT8916385.1 MarR family transcriptional regulator [Amycolatopsis sp. PS_44_ISF1]MDT8916389.1 MarR family transcriptional regulator [Amycolatopsis sp. PS_44_ISF1]